MWEYFLFERKTNRKKNIIKDFTYRILLLRFIFGWWLVYECVRCLFWFFSLFFSNDDSNWPLNQFRIKWLWLIIYFFATVFCLLFSSLRWMFERCVMFEFDLCSAHMCSICNKIQFWWNGFAGKRIDFFFSLSFGFRALKFFLAELNTHWDSIALNLFCICKLNNFWFFPRKMGSFFDWISVNAYFFVCDRPTNPKTIYKSIFKWMPLQRRGKNLKLKFYNWQALEF